MPDQVQRVLGTQKVPVIPVPNSSDFDIGRSKSSSQEVQCGNQYVYVTINQNNAVHFTAQDNKRELYEAPRFPEVLLEALRPLDLEDWKRLASRLNLDTYTESIEVEVKNHQKSPTRLLLDEYWKRQGRNASIETVKMALLEMGRTDLKEYLEDAEMKMEGTVEH